jgi:hypothetical protein
MSATDIFNPRDDAGLTLLLAIERVSELLDKIGHTQPSLSHIEQYEFAFGFEKFFGHFYAVGSVLPIRCY